MKVLLTYFKNSGKYYSNGEYNTDFTSIHDIWEEIKIKATYRRLLGLVFNHSPYHILVDIPEHIHNHPLLIPIHTYLS